MKQFKTRFKQTDVLEMVKHFMDKMDKIGLFSLFKKYIGQTLLYRLFYIDLTIIWSYAFMKQVMCFTQLECWNSEVQHVL